MTQDPVSATVGGLSGSENCVSGYEPFDPITCFERFPGAYPLNENKEILNTLMNALEKIVPKLDEKQCVNSLATKIKGIIDLLRMDGNCYGISDFHFVGSFKKDTMLAEHRVVDIVVLLNHQPIFRETFTMADVFKNELSKTIADKVTVRFRSYGFDLEVSDATAVVAFAYDRFILGENSITTAKCVGDAHQYVALSSIQHAHWAEQFTSHDNVKALVRLLKDLKRRFVGFNHLNPWQIDLLAVHASMNQRDQSLVPLGLAFRRVIQLLAAGLFLPGRLGLVDPCDPFHRGVNLLLPSQMDELCCAAQAMCSIVNLGKTSVIFEELKPDGLIPIEDLVHRFNTLPGIKITAPVPISQEPNETKAPSGS